jgi:hypothetical protein
LKINGRNTDFSSAKADNFLKTNPVTKSRGETKIGVQSARFEVRQIIAGQQQRSPEEMRIAG